MGNLSYVKPYKYLEFGGQRTSGNILFGKVKNKGATTAHAKEYIDFTAKEGLHHLLIEGWNKGWTPAWTKNRMHGQFHAKCR